MEALGGVVKNYFFELPTYQRRLRHLKSISVRNVTLTVANGSLKNRQEALSVAIYFTLHTSRNDQEAFYTSEKMRGTLNPTWRSFNLNQIESLDLTSMSVIVKIWTECYSGTSLVALWTVDLTGLTYVGDKLKNESMFAANTVLFGMFDKLFTAPAKNEQVSETAVQSLLKVDQASVRWSYTTNTLNRVKMVQRAIKQTQATVDRHKTSIQDKILRSQVKSIKMAAQEVAILRVNQLRNELEVRTMLLQTLKEQCEQLQTKNHHKDVSIKEKQESLKKDATRLEDKRKMYVSTRENYIKTNAALILRKKQILYDLALIYPLKEYENKVFTVCDVNLPNSEEFQGFDETMVAISLGYTSHMVQMISQFLDIPLRYPIMHRSSRSKIRDHITHKIQEKDRDFPLYSKGKQRDQFNYAVYLLNKNIAQMRFYCGLGTQDLRLTLPNLKSLLELRLGVKYDQKKLRPFDRALSVTNSSDSPSPMPSPGILSPAPTLTPGHVSQTIQLHQPSVADIVLTFPTDGEDRQTADRGNDTSTKTHLLENHLLDLVKVGEDYCTKDNIDGDVKLTQKIRNPFLNDITDNASCSSYSGEETPSRQYESKFKTWVRNDNENNCSSGAQSSGETDLW